MRILLIILFCLTSYIGVEAQCIDFAKSIGKEPLGDYLHDGNYNAAILEEGEKAELFKTFFSGENYRIAISKVEQLPDIHFKLRDKQGNVLFDNEEHNYRLTWDFKVETTQLLIVEMNILEHGNSELISGCVAVMFGIESIKRKKR
ncbi:hypothetical protein [uncultured Carboxylicivirga sp.]|uniref:hypothetical protein n=1 Tax=uncultured Carboxylicivirga sp. TaxID=1628156 RepID=UPI002611833B|nr:hypothetical protein [uncultured Carboxylicivirga sp.]